MKRQSFRLLFTASLLLLDVCGLALAFELAYRTRFLWPSFLTHFPATKGIPDIALYHQALRALLPVCALVFFYAGFYKDALLSAYDEFVRVVRGVILCSLMAMALTFAYRGAEYSRLVIGLWALYSITWVYLLREMAKSLLRRLQDWLVGPQRTLIIGKGKAIEALRQMTAQQPLVKALLPYQMIERPQLCETL